MLLSGNTPAVDGSRAPTLNHLSVSSITNGGKAAYSSLVPRLIVSILTGEQSLGRSLAYNKRMLMRQFHLPNIGSTCKSVCPEQWLGIGGWHRGCAAADSVSMGST